ncbi:helix-turn-helix domain-containing protein [Paractinoplanes lichenicola]|uniref:Helix-turn-helix domain-containing protein n=1 Tax=Paractinoplanes lichenicola TaxID=2802976 RepID=A0ABS1W1A4_9ACTN|nr:helix-turn-helix domain-containing protein [Actinoplanes lichenicola]MBL7260500.1 helix-turn-helix domain-containing protein [Actinoplanes lichenicola]
MLSASEQHAYRLLVRMAGAAPADLAAQAALSGDEARALLEALHRKGLATAGPIFHALPADVALGDALLREQQSLESARRLVAALSEEYRTNTRRRSPEHLVEIVVGAAALRDRLREMQDSAREEILWFCRANPIAMQGPENTEESTALERGVRYRAIYERELLEKPGELDSIVDAMKLGELSRTLPHLPVRLAVADRALAICPLVPDAARGVGEPTAALIRPSELLDALVALFESYWERATPLLPDGSEEEPDKLLLSLFVAGLPDKSIATQLGVSRRTVQRRLDRLMEAAGVDTRAGLAFQAARRGWL